MSDLPILVRSREGKAIVVCFKSYSDVSKFEQGGKERRKLLCLDQVIVSSCVRRSFYLGEGQAAEVAFPTCERTRSATAHGLVDKSRDNSLLSIPEPKQGVREIFMKGLWLMIRWM